MHGRSRPRRGDDEAPRHRIVSEGAPRARRAARPYLLALYCAVFAIFGMVVWFAWEETFGLADDVPLVRAPERPLKRVPEQRGGLPVENEGAVIVRLLEGGQETPRVERVLPRGEPPARTPVEADPSLAEPPADERRAIEPLSAAEVPATPPGPFPVPVDGAGPVERAAASAASEGTSTAEEAGSPSQGDADEPAVAVTEPAPSPDGAFVPGPPPPKPRRLAALDSGDPLSPPTAAPRQSGPTSPAPASPGSRGHTGEDAEEERSAALATRSPSPPASAARAGAGPWRIQIAALRSRDAADVAWQRLRQRYPEVLGRLAPQVEEATISGGTIYRVQAGSFADRSAAARACAALKDAGGDCFVVGTNS